MECSSKRVPDLVAWNRFLTPDVPSADVTPELDAHEPLTSHAPSMRGASVAIALEASTAFTGQSSSVTAG
jgi:hypothetical protein